MQTIEVKDCFSHPQVGWLTVNQAPTIYRLRLLLHKVLVGAKQSKKADTGLAPISASYQSGNPRLYSIPI